MKRIAVVALLSLALATSVFAQAQDTVTVTAAVQAVVVFTVDTPLGGATFDFGNVDAVGTSGPYNAGLVVVPGPTSTTYTAAGAFEWELRRSPRANADVTSVASKTVGGSGPDALGRASMALGQLEMLWNQTLGNGTVTSVFTPIGASNTWIDNAVVGNGNAGVAPRNEGTIDLRLTVDDDDLAESNEWTIVFTATLS